MELIRSSLNLARPTGSPSRFLIIEPDAHSEGLDRTGLILVERRAPSRVRGGMNAFRAGRAAGQRMFGGPSQPGFFSGMAGGKKGGTLGHAAGQWLGHRLGLAGASHAAEVTKLKRQVEKAKLQKQLQRLGGAPAGAAPAGGAPAAGASASGASAGAPTGAPAAPPPRQKSMLPKFVRKAGWAVKRFFGGGKPPALNKHADFQGLHPDKRKAILNTAREAFHAARKKAAEGARHGAAPIEGADKAAIFHAVKQKHGVELGEEPMDAIHKGLAGTKIGRKEAARAEMEKRAAAGGQAPAPATPDREGRLAQIRAGREAAEKAKADAAAAEAAKPKRLEGHKDVRNLKLNDPEKHKALLSAVRKAHANQQAEFDKVGPPEAGPGGIPEAQARKNVLRNMVKKAAASQGFDLGDEALDRFHRVAEKHTIAQGAKSAQAAEKGAEAAQKAAELGGKVARFKRGMQPRPAPPEPKAPEPGQQLGLFDQPKPQAPEAKPEAPPERTPIKTPTATPTAAPASPKQVPRGEKGMVNPVDLSPEHQRARQTMAGAAAKLKDADPKQRAAALGELKAKAKEARGLVKGKPAMHPEVAGKPPEKPAPAKQPAEPAAQAAPAAPKAPEMGPPKEPAKPEAPKPEVQPAAPSPEAQKPEAAPKPAAPGAEKAPAAKRKRGKKAEAPPAAAATPAAGAPAGAPAAAPAQAAPAGGGGKAAGKGPAPRGRGIAQPRDPGTGKCPEGSRPGGNANACYPKEGHSDEHGPVGQKEKGGEQKPQGQ